QKPKTYFDPAANANAELSAKFNYILCVSRFAHYLKVMARDKIGSFMEVKDCERWLNEWIMNYVVGNPETASEETKAQKPLAAASIEVREVKGKPGWYEAVAYLRPHFQLETLSTSMRLVAEAPKRACCPMQRTTGEKHQLASGGFYPSGPHRRDKLGGSPRERFFYFHSLLEVNNNGV